MTKAAFIFLCLIHTSGIMAHNCTKELAAQQLSVFEKSTSYNAYRVKDPVVKKNGEDMLNLIFASLKDARGLHGISDISNSNDGTGGLSAFGSDIYLYSIYCQKGGGFNWNGMFNFKIQCMANNLSKLVDHLTDEYIGIGRNKDVMVNNSRVYIFNSSKNHSQIKGYNYYETKDGGAVLVTKPGATLFRPVSRREYLLLLRKSEEATLVRLKKNLSEFLQNKIAAEKGTEKYKSNKEVEDLNNKLIDVAVKDLEDIGRFTAEQTEGWMNKPFITNHFFGPPTSHSLASETDYFLDAPGDGNEWIIINPDYLNKKVPLTAPQFFYVKWGDARSIAEKKAVELFMENFNFDKLQALLVK